MTKHEKRKTKNGLKKKKDKWQNIYDKNKNKNVEMKIVKGRKIEHMKSRENREDTKRSRNTERED